LPGRICLGGGEERKIFSEDTEKTGEREREKYAAVLFEISHTKKEITVL